MKIYFHLFDRENLEELIFSELIISTTIRYFLI